MPIQYEITNMIEVQNHNPVITTVCRVGDRNNRRAEKTEK